MDKDKLDAGYREEGWGKITDAAFGGRVRPSDVEAGARIVAQYASDALAKAEVENDALWKRIRDMSVAHDARVTELLAANNREVEERRLARAEADVAFRAIWAVVVGFGGMIHIDNRTIQRFDKKRARIVFSTDPGEKSISVKAAVDEKNPGVFMTSLKENGN